MLMDPLASTSSCSVGKFPVLVNVQSFWDIMYVIHVLSRCMHFLIVYVSLMSSLFTIRIIFCISHTQAYLISTNFVTFHCVLPLRYYHVNFLFSVSRIETTCSSFLSLFSFLNAARRYLHSMHTRAFATLI